MPGVPPPNSTSFQYMLAQTQNRLRALETQQQTVISNLQGQPVIVLGLQPGSNPPRWGFGVLRKTFRQVAAFFGEDQTGTVGLYYAGPGANGFTRLSSPTSVYVVTTVSTTSTTPSPLLGGPSVTVTVSKSGRALVTVGAKIYLPPRTTAAAIEGAVGVRVDGTTIGRTVPVSAYITGTAGFQTAGGNSFLVSNLVPGTHTFETIYSSLFGQSVTFSDRELTVLPY